MVDDPGIGVPAEDFMALLDLPSKSVSLRSAALAAAKAVAVATMLGLLSACGGGASAPASPAVVQNPTQNPTPPDPGPVTGVAMPQNVSVVTANNAN
jgi:hypothetical protein